MELVAHRINTVAGLADLPRDMGAEIDLRADRGRLILHHEPHLPGDDFEAFLDAWEHGLLVLEKPFSVAALRQALEQVR